MSYIELYKSYKIFTPDDTEDERPERKVAFVHSNRFFFLDEAGNKERVELRANLGTRSWGKRPRNSPCRRSRYVLLISRYVCRL